MNIFKVEEDLNDSALHIKSLFSPVLNYQLEEAGEEDADEYQYYWDEDD